METIESVIAENKTIYMLGAKSKESVKLQKKFLDAGKMIAKIWDVESIISRTSELQKLENELRVLEEGILINAVELRYAEKMEEVCQNVLNIKCIDGFELLHSDVYLECEKNNLGCSLKKCRNCSVAEHSCPIRRDYYNNKRDKTIKQIAVKLGFICNLKCKFCCEFLPYYEKEQVAPFDVNLYKADIKKISSACEYIHTLSISGGDVMLNRGLAELLDYISDIENIGDIYILTNGTYMPHIEILDALQRNRERVHIQINDYKINKKAEPLMKELARRNVSCRLRHNEGWYDFTNIKFRNRSEEELKQLFRDCAFDRSDSSYFIYCAGKITMRCGVANGIGQYLNLYEQMKDDCADIRAIPTDEVVAELNRIEKKGFVGMCNYCKGCEIHDRNLQPAECQIEGVQR